MLVVNMVTSINSSEAGCKTQCRLYLSPIGKEIQYQCVQQSINSKSSVLIASENDQTTTNTLKKRKRNTKNGKPVTQKELSEKYPTEKIEYYIHYDNHDRRLDEWVRRDRMRPLDEDVGEVRIIKRAGLYLTLSFRILKESNRIL